MKPEELRKLDIMPFDRGAMSDGICTSVSEREDTARFAVMLRYLERFAGQAGILPGIPLMNTCLKRDASYRSGYSGFYKSKKEIMDWLFMHMLLETGWNYGTCEICDESFRNLEVYPPGNCGIQSWYRAAIMVPELLTLEQKGFEDVVATVCWSERVARYCQYASASPREVDHWFGEEAATIRRILCKMADPYAMGSPMQGIDGSVYVMAFFEGVSDEVTVSSEDMDYNFFIQGMVLHLLLSRAEELFGLPC